MNIDHYLHQVFRFSFFPKRERQDLSEELKTHLEDVALRFQRKARAYQKKRRYRKQLNNVGNRGSYGLISRKMPLAYLVPGLFEWAFCFSFFL